MILSVLIWTIFLILGYFLYTKGTENENWFKDQNVKYLKPAFLFGNTRDFILGKLNLYDIVKGFYDSFPEEKAVGIFEMRTPILIIKDPALIKRIIVKEFDHFVDHRILIDESMDDLFGKSLISLTGQKWRDMRSTLSPAFTGSKMRLMFDLILNVCSQMVDHMNAEMEPNEIRDYEMKEFCSRFTNDVIALCAFGLRVNSLDDENNEFFQTGKKMMDFNQPKRILKVAGFKIVPQLMKMLGIQLFGDVKDYFKGIITNTMDTREKENIFRPDMINQLMEMRKGTLTHNEKEDEKDSMGFAAVSESEVGKNVHTRKWSDDEIIAQCFLFFLAGFDTISTVVSFGVYEITLNPDVQEKLYQEAKLANDSLNGKSINYDVLQKMKYLDMVVSEILRKRTPNPFTDRICTKDMNFDDGDGFKFNFKKGQMLWIPIHGLHQDPKYFPNPDTFDPERFSDENKHLLNQDAYVPFGVGPRSCIGSRFALMEIKALLYFLVLNFSLNVVEKTQIPLVLKKSLGQLIPEKGIWVGFKARK